MGPCQSFENEGNRVDHGINQRWEAITMIKLERSADFSLRRWRMQDWGLGMRVLLASLASEGNRRIQYLERQGVGRQVLDRMVQMQVADSGDVITYRIQRVRAM